MNTTNNRNAFLGAGIIAAALAAAGVEMFPNGAHRGRMSKRGSVVALGRASHRAIAYTLQACLDGELCEWSAYHLNTKMVGDERESLWQSDQGQGAGVGFVTGRGCAWFVMTPARMAILCGGPPMAAICRKQICQNRPKFLLGTFSAMLLTRAETSKEWEF